MPAFSFKERFVPMVKDGSKPHTIRTFRRTPVTVGQKAHLYTGMRTKHCTKLVDESPDIIDVKSIAIFPDGKVWLMDTPWLLPKERELVKQGKRIRAVKTYTLGSFERDSLAYNDGFRAHNLGIKGCINGSFDLMVNYWTEENELPFVGFITYWDVTKIKEVANV